MKFSVFQRSEQAGRKKNEDRMGYTYTSESAVFVLADGMGGHAHGELAAQIALEAITSLFKETAKPVLPDVRAFLSKALLFAHHQIMHFANEHSMRDSPRTTAVILVVQKGMAAWAHCGDSRLYHMRGGQLATRTLDHSYVEQMPQGITVSPQTLESLVNRNVLFTCLGAPTKPIYNVTQDISLQAGDRFLLCSDGLWSQFEQEALTQLFAQDAVTTAVPLLIDLALKRGGRYCDNVTAIGMEWESYAVSHGVQTERLLHGDFASTVQGHLVESHPEQSSMDFDEGDIERSLHEINQVIHKSYAHLSDKSSANHPFVVLP
jgi:PPM family protein phosphatase